MTRVLRILESAALPPAEAASVESDFVVILAALLCALICVFGLIAVARCAWLRRVPVGRAGDQRQAVANRGLKKKVLNSLPKFTYVAGDEKKWVESSECAICLAEFAAGDEVRVLPQCGHGFHLACIDTWLGSHSSCPSCRSVLAVPRCQKCGQFPAGPGSAAETESKPGDSEGGKAANTNCSNSNHSVNNDFLP